MTKASDNAFPSLLITEGTEPSAPAAGKQRLYIDSTTHLLKATNSSGTDRTIEAGAAVGNLWTMAKGAGLGDQTLTNNTLTQITFDTAAIDGGGSVIDHANERFTAPATGFYLAFAHWPWGTTTPSQAANVEIRVGATAMIPVGRMMPTTATVTTFGGIEVSGALSLTSGDFVTMWVNPGAITGVVARGSATVAIRTTFTLVRIT